MITQSNSIAIPITTPEKMWKPVCFIRGEVASSKNSRRNFYGNNPRTGKKQMMSLPSKFASSYMNNAMKQLLVSRRDWFNRIEGLKPPLHIGFYFHRETNRKADYSNLVQAIQDCMVKLKYIEDDNMTCLVPHFLGNEKNKENPGVMIYL